MAGRKEREVGDGRNWRGKRKIGKERRGRKEGKERGETAKERKVGIKGGGGRRRDGRKNGNREDRKEVKHSGREGMKYEREVE